VSKARGKIESFEPANVSGLDTRIWQGRGTATDASGVEFSLRGEIVKVPGIKKMLYWERNVPPPAQQSDDQGAFPDLAEAQEADWAALADQAGTTPISPTAGIFGPEKNPFNGRDVLTLGTFVWDTTTELLVAFYTPWYLRVAAEGGLEAVGQALSSGVSIRGGFISIAVLETNRLKTIHEYRVTSSGSELEARYFPRFTDIGPYVLITVEGQRVVKWDGRIRSFAGIHDVPAPPQASLLFGEGDNTDVLVATTPNLVGDFWEDHSLNQDDATGVTITYYQTYVNSFGQESNLSPPSNAIKLSDLLRVHEAKSNNQSVATYGGYGSWAAYNAAHPSPSSFSSGFGPGFGSTGATLTSSTTSTGTYATDSTTGVAANSQRSEDEIHGRLIPFISLGASPGALDITNRIIYRSIGGQSPVSLPRFLGAAAQTHFDIRKVGETSASPAPVPGENSPPPPARWAFPFRGRVYYRGTKSTLYYSKLNFPESVAATNFIEINTADGDDITAWGMSQDYAIIFKRDSAYLLTHDKKEEPVITPLQSTFGAITDRAVVSFDNKTYFLSDVGFHMFDGAQFRRISSVLDEKVRQLPVHTRERAVVFSDKKENRVYIAVNANPGIENNEIWVIHTDTGSFSIVDNRPISAAVVLKDEVVVAVPSDAYAGRSDTDLYLWGKGYDFVGAGYSGSFSTEWLEVKNPHSDKRFYKLLLYFVHTGEISLDVDWFLDWDNSTKAGSSSVVLRASDSILWNDASSTAPVSAWPTSTSTNWEGPRLVSKFIDLPELSGTTDQTITGKSVRFTFSTSATNTPFRLVGWQLIADDYGERAEGSSSR